MSDDHVYGVEFEHNRTNSASRAIKAASTAMSIALALLLSAFPFSSCLAAGDANADTFDYSGGYTGYFVADGQPAEVTNEDAEVVEPNQNAALAENGGLLAITEGKLSKSGDGDDTDTCDRYGVNSIALAANEASRTLLNGTVLEASSTGSNGVFATDSATAFANGVTVTTAADNSRGITATYGGTTIADNATILTQGDYSAGVSTGQSGGYVSVTNANLTTNGSDSPLLQSSGTIEADNVSGTAAKSQIASIDGANELMISNSTLTSTSTGSTTSDPIANGIMVYSSSSDNASASANDTALFQVADSTLESSIKSGSLFYLTNTEAKMVLSNTKLSFDESSAKLITATGNDVNGWGKAGKNGAEVTFTNLKQKVKGDIEVDSISSVDFYLLDKSGWEGSSSITTRSGATEASDNLTVNIDGTSTWIVSENSTVTNLNLANGAKLVDADGDSVKIVDADGLTLVDGASDVKITVTDDFTTSVKTGSANELENASIDRSAFDATFEIDTTFGTNGTESVISDEERVLQMVAYIRAWFGVS